MYRRPSYVVWTLGMTLLVAPIVASCAPLPKRAAQPMPTAARTFTPVVQPTSIPTQEAWGTVDERQAMILVINADGSDPYLAPERTITVARLVIDLVALWSVNRPIWGSSPRGDGWRVQVLFYVDRVHSRQRMIYLYWWVSPSGVVYADDTEATGWIKDPRTSFHTPMLPVIYKTR